MFNGYTADFPYSYVTAKLVRAFPTWTKIRKDPNALGAQFLNVFGLEVQEVDGFLQAALDNQYIGTANIGEVAWIYKTRFKTDDADSVTIVQGFDFSATPNPTDMQECVTLFEFYGSNIDDHPFIIDFGAKTLYFKQNYSWIKFGSESLTDILAHHVWNVFDEFALLLGIRRRFMETNSELKERVLDVFRFPGNSTKLGLQRAVGRELGLVFSTTWPEDSTSFVINEEIEGISIIPETFIVNGQVLQDGQYEYDYATKEYTIYPKYRVFYDKNLSYQFSNTVLSPTKTVKLVSGVKQGHIITPVINPSNLKEWSTIVIDGDGDIKVDIVRYDFDKYVDQSKAYIVKGITGVTNLLGTTPIRIEEPIRLIITLSRPLRTDTVELRNITLEYVPKEAVVSCIHDVQMEALHDDAFRNSLFEVDGSPSQKLKNYVDELNTFVPIMWGKWKWDESYWDVVGKNLMGLHVLPNKWDPRLGEIANAYLQTGIGDGYDCKIKFEDVSWSPLIHSGFYYLSVKETHTADGTNIIYTRYKNPQFVTITGTDPSGNKISPTVIGVKKNRIQTSPVAAGSMLIVSFCAEHYVYAKSAIENFIGPTSEVTLENFPMQGAPIIVNATRDSEQITLSQVSFVVGGEPSIVNVEEIYGNGTNQIALNYADPIGVVVSGCEVLATDENIIMLDRTIESDELLSVLYRQQDSFVLTVEDGTAKLIFSDEYADIEVVLESQDQTAYREYDLLSFDPMFSHITDGFVYITGAVPELNDFDIKVHPDVICADAVDSCTIIVDCIDRYGNPVLNVEPNYSVEMTRDDTGSVVAVNGTLELVGTFYNRKVYRYIAPDSDDMPLDVNDNIIPCSTKITFTSGIASEIAEIKVR